MGRHGHRRHFSGVYIFAAVFAALLLLAACDRAPSQFGASGTAATRNESSAVGGAGETVEIHIRNFRFNPGEVRVKRNTRVVFINEDEVEHNIIQSSGNRIGAGPASFESPVLTGGQRWSKVFTEPGEYPIVCTVDGHQLMGMVGTIIVEDD